MTFTSSSTILASVPQKTTAGSEANRRPTVSTPFDSFRLRSWLSCKGQIFFFSRDILRTIAHLARECRRNVHYHEVAELTSGSFEKGTCGANPHSRVFNNDPDFAARNAVDMETDSCFGSACRRKTENIPHTRNNWLCYDFKERRIVPTHRTIRTIDNGPGCSHPKSWLVETSADGMDWREVAREENNEQLNDKFGTGTFPVAGGGEIRFIRLVNIGRNHCGDDILAIPA
jgi:hypothetical protein